PPLRKLVPVRLFAPVRINLAVPDFVSEEAVPLSAMTELMVRSALAYWWTTRSLPLAPLSVPPVMAVAPLPVTNNPPEVRVNVPSRVTVEAAVSLNELMFVPSPMLATGFPLRLTLLAAAQVVGSLLVV